MSKRLIIVDVSNFIFRAFFAVRQMNAPDGTPTNALHGVLMMMRKMLADFRPTHLLLARDTKGGSFRNEIYDAYKANRTEPPEELVPQFALIDQAFEKLGMPSISNDRYEADDIIGSAVTQWKNEFDEILIASGDKDLMQFVDGNIKMLDTMKNKIYESQDVVEKMGVRPDQIVDYLSMVGDTSDNIPGMRGIGAKGAAKLLAEYGTLEACIAAKDSFKGKKLVEAFSEHLEEGLLSKKLIQIVTDMELPLKAEDTHYSFHPNDDFIDFMKSLGLKMVMSQFLELRQSEEKVAHAQKSKQTGEDTEPMLVNLSQESHASLVEIEVVNNDSFENFLTLLQGWSAIGTHTAYDSEDPLGRKLVGIAISGDGHKAYWLPFVGEEALSAPAFKKLLASCWGATTHEWLSEHVKTDLSFALREGINFSAPTFDISQVHYNLSADRAHTIEALAKEHLNLTITNFNLKKEAPLLADAQWAAKTFGERAAAIYEISRIFKNELKEKELASVYYDIDDKLFPVLAKMENYGISIDVDYFKNYENELDKTLSDLQTKVWEAAGEEFNLNSPKQLGVILYEKLKLPVLKTNKTGPSTDAEVLEELASRDLHPLPNLLMDYREIGKLLSTYVKAIPLLVNSQSGKIHTHFNQNVAATGRLSSTDPNLQNIPVRTELGKKVRRGFIATPGNVLVGADYSQVELRLLAHFSQDPTMVQAFRDDQDIHAQTASEVLGIALKDINSSDRSKAKAVNFGLMYGQSSFGLAKALRISRTEARDYITKYFERFNHVKSYLDGLKEEAERHGYAITLHGRRRYLPDIHSSNRTIKANAERMAINSPIQGTAADIIKLAMIEVDRRLMDGSFEATMLLQVHDELIFEVREDHADKLAKMVKEVMESVVDLTIPLRVDVGIAKNWYELK